MENFFAELFRLFARRSPRTAFVFAFLERTDGSTDGLCFQQRAALSPSPHERRRRVSVALALASFGPQSHRGSSQSGLSPLRGRLVASPTLRNDSTDGKERILSAHSAETHLEKELEKNMDSSSFHLLASLALVGIHGCRRMAAREESEHLSAAAAASAAFLACRHPHRAGGSTPAAGLLLEKHWTKFPCSGTRFFTHFLPLVSDASSPP